MRILLATLLIAWGQFLSAQKLVYFPGFELINMETTEGLQYATSKLIKSYIEDNHDYTILIDEQLGTGAYLTKEPMSAAIEKAKALKASYVMQGEIHFIQGIYIVSVGVYATEDQARVWHDMAKGAIEQDLDPLLSRLGRSFFTTKTAKTDIEVDEVTQYDQQGLELAQIKVNHFVGLMLGGKQIPHEGVLSGFGLVYTYDASTFLFNLDFELFPSSSFTLGDLSDTRKIHTGNINLGVTYPLSRKRSTFYINGGMEYGYATLKNDELFDSHIKTETGIGAYFGGGFLINRNSTVNVRLFTNVSLPFYRVEDTAISGFKFGIITSFARKR